MKNIHVLATDKPSRFRFVDGILKKYNNVSVVSLNSVHIYITSDEEIKEGDYGLGFALGIKGVGRGYYVFKQDGTNVGKLNAICNGSKKIILTTDQDLIKDGVQAIDDEFLEWFVKNPSCEFVNIITHYPTIDDEGDGTLSQQYYTFTIPQEEPKQETLEEASLKYCEKRYYKSTD